MIYRTIIIDDEQRGVDALKVLIETHCKQLKIVATCNSPVDGLQLVENLRPDILFLDINMPTMNAFEMYERLSFKQFKLIFATAHPEFAFKAVKIRPHDYLLKPIDVDELKACIAGLVKKEETEVLKTEEHVLDLSVKSGIIFIRPREIIRLEADGSYTTFYMLNGQRHVVSKSLKDCEMLLNSLYFYRCHNSHIINLRQVKRLITTDGFYCKMSDGSTAEVVKKNKEELLLRLTSVEE